MIFFVRSRLCFPAELVAWSLDASCVKRRKFVVQFCVVFVSDVMSAHSQLFRRSGSLLHFGFLWRTSAGCVYKIHTNSDHNCEDDDEGYGNDSYHAGNVENIVDDEMLG